MARVPAREGGQGEVGMSTGTLIDSGQVCRRVSGWGRHGAITRSTPDGDGERESWLEQAPAGDVVFAGAEFVEDYAVLRWDTGRGSVGLVHSLVDGNASCKTAVRALHNRHGARLGDRYACVVAAQTATQVTQPYVPQLLAYDVGTSGKQYETTWAQLEAVLGQPAPYWFHALRDRDAIAAWRPGAPLAVVPARDIATPVTALTELAADEPDGSPAAEVCWYLAREVRRRGHTEVTRHIAELQENAADGGDGAHLVLGAVPAPLLRPDPPEMVRRAGWLRSRCASTVSDGEPSRGDACGFAAGSAARAGP